ncbi:MAG: PQQ-dependent sugar dehydrogenase [Gammaproteobacteria bacterium]|nr:PQQ-dependent sugar dehydrogenase [Gammaproteobacteria bacterium]
MSVMKVRYFGLAYLLIASVGACADVNDLVAPNGFTISVVSDDVANARQMALSDAGTLFVGTRRAGKVYAIANALGDNPGKRVTVAKGLTMPSGVAVRGTDLYVGALDRILRFANVEKHLWKNAKFEVITDQLPDKTHHGWKHLGFGPDGSLYFAVGAPCNICLSEDPRFASILRMDPQSGDTSVYASGVRNTVGFDWHPVTRALWFTDNGRDMLGDDVPFEEVNVAAEPGLHFGYPFVHGGDLLDPKFGTDVDPATYVLPTIKIQAHSAALGVGFYTSTQFPEKYANALFIAEHGSWNRSSKVGYRVSVVTFDESGSNYEPFVTGWLDGQKNWGRPTDVLMAPDGSLLISDDKAGAIYRVHYTNARG